MDSWQAWAAALFGFVLSLIMFNHKREKQRADKTIDDFNAHKMEVMERMTRLEAEVMTEREVREILQEFLQPFLASLQKIDNKTDSISKDIVDLKIQMSSIPKRKDDKDE